MNLDTGDKYLEIVLGEVMVTNNCDITASYATVDTSTFLLGASSTVSNGTTPVTVVSAPLSPTSSVPNSGSQRQVKEIRLHNNDTVTHNVTLQLVDTGTTRIVDTQAVVAGGDYLYTPEGGSSLVDPAPAILVESGAAAKISAMPAVNTATLAGTEIAPWVQAGANASWSLTSLYTVLASIVDFLPANPLNAAAASNLQGGTLNFTAGDGDGGGLGGPAGLFGGLGGSSGQGGPIQIEAGAAGGGNNAGGTILVTSGQGSGTGNGGTISLIGGTSGSGATGNGASIGIVPGAATSTNGDSGDVLVNLVAGTGAGRQGLVLTSGLPTVDPAVSGALWSNLGVLMVSP